ncbi:MAG: glycosyltransferase family 4 protein [Actinomycetota bacterium]
MRIVLVTGLYPPDIGGPATHVDDLRRELIRRGHEACVLTLGDAAPDDSDPDVVRYPRAWPWPARMAAVAGWLVRNAARYDAVYATGLQPAAVAGARAAGRPVVVKVVGDLSWERGRRLGLTSADFDAFQAGSDRNDLRVRAMGWVQNATLRAADEITAPSETLRDTIEGWLGGPAPIEVIPNGVGPVPAPGTRSDVEPFVFVGRLVAHKRVDRIIEAVASIPGARLEVLGDGPERDRLTDLVGALDVEDRVTIAGTARHEDVVLALARAAALVLASDYEGLPHVVLEALACGTPVVSPPVGGVPEVVTDGKSGLLVPDASVGSLMRALRRILEDGELAAKLRAGAREAGDAWGIERTADRTESLLRRAIAGRPKAVFLGKTRVAPALPELDAKLRVMTRHVRTSLIGVGRAGVRPAGVARTYAFPQGRPRAAGSALFFAAAPLLAVAIASRRGPAAIVCQSPYEAAGAVMLVRVLPRRLRPRVVVELHGDWRSASRLYGGAARRALASLADRSAAAAIRRADRVRVVGRFTEELARATGWRGPIDRFPAFSEYELFLGELSVDPPDEPSVLFVGALEAVKGVDVLLEAWPAVRMAVPSCRLTIAGEGSMAGTVRSWAAEEPGVLVAGAVPREDVRRLIDAATLIVLPSRSEGLGRVVLEAFGRARPVVASRVGGIPELVVDGANGLLVPPGDRMALAGAIVRLLEDREIASTMGARARVEALERDPAAAFESGIERLARWIAEP